MNKAARKSAVRGVAGVTPDTGKGTRGRGGPAPQVRDAAATQRRILAAATSEFARKGLSGARVDVIAARARANKRMLYHYFGNKDQLFRRVLEEAYLGIRTAEQTLDLDDMEPRRALETLVRFTWDYYLAHPEFLALVNSANLHKARHLEGSQAIGAASRRFVGMVETLLARGVETGVFRPGVDPVQLNITIAAIGYYYLTNRHTGSIIFERDLVAPAALDARLAFNIDTILRLVRAD
ncbi:MAG: TetR/AcrR family transcriptional regulator [Hyphomicrobiaceae bacterium]